MNTDAPWPDLDEAESRVLKIQTKLHRWARDDPHRRFDDLFNLVADPAVLLIAIVILVIAGLWKTFSKAGQPGWAAIIPIFNVYILLKVAGRPGWWLLLYLIPLVQAQQSVVHEDAGQPVAHGTMNQNGCDGRVDPARQPADDARADSCSSHRRHGRGERGRPERSPPWRPRAGGRGRPRRRRRAARTSRRRR